MTPSQRSRCQSCPRRSPGATCAHRLLQPPAPGPPAADEVPQETPEQGGKGARPAGTRRAPERAVPVGVRKTKRGSKSPAETRGAAGRSLREWGTQPRLSGRPPHYPSHGLAGLRRVFREKPEVWVFMCNLPIFKGWHPIHVLLKPCPGHRKPTDLSLRVAVAPMGTRGGPRTADFPEGSPAARHSHVEPGSGLGPPGGCPAPHFRCG